MSQTAAADDSRTKRLRLDPETSTQVASKGSAVGHTPGVSSGTLNCPDIRNSSRSPRPAPAPNADNHSADPLVAANPAVNTVLEAGAALIPNALNADECAQLGQEITTRLDTVMARLESLGISARSESCPPFSYKEAASRCPGRLDIRFNGGSHLNSLLASADKLVDVCRGVLGADATLLYTGVVMSFAGSVDQGWHVDGDHLSEKQLPPHALTVFVADSTVPPDAGLPEFFLQSHRLDEVGKLTTGEPVDPPVSFPFEQGSAIVFDYRVVHRGTANRSSRDRPLVYCVFARAGWEDEVNFNRQESLFKEPAALEP
eukprot:m.51849 g.51849  ORF g.51849 m.51849 type:complete len:316 (-) comp9073_c0_seq2:2220-3167(-)